nr:CPBP family intramembrane glutamic endopeptidase [Ancylobacter oerskovii]
MIRRYPIIAYFVIAYGGSWFVWAFFFLSQEGSGLLPFHAPASFLLLTAVGTFSGPTVSAFVVTAVTEGREGVARLLRRIVRWRVGLLWYAFVFIGLPAIETIGTIAIPGALAETTPIDIVPELAAAAVFFAYPGLLAGPLGEEIGWRGYALPRLQEIWGPVKASLILGLLWAFWHSPIWFSGQWTVPSLPNIAAYVFWITAVTFIYTWVFNNTRGSVFVAILLHGVMDVFPNAFLMEHLPGLGQMTSLGVLSMYLGLGLGFGVFALLLVIFTKGRLGYRAAEPD